MPCEIPIPSNHVNTRLRDGFIVKMDTQEYLKTLTSQLPNSEDYATTIHLSSWLYIWPSSLWSCEQRCIVCIDPACTFFETENEGEDTCFCGHSRSEHRTRQQFRQRGGLNRPGLTCVEFRTIGGGPIESFHQPCVCGGRYSEHQQLRQTVLPQAGPQIPVINQPGPSQNVFPVMSQTQIGGSQHPMVNQPQNALPTISRSLQSQPALVQLPTMSFGLRTAVETQPPPVQMRSVMPYSSAFASATPEPVFGIPLGQPSSSSTGLRRSRRSNHGAAGVQRTRKLCLNVMIILLPRDISPNARMLDGFGFPGPSHIPTGELLDQWLKFLKSKGLALTVELKCKRAEESLLSQILDHFNSMVTRGSFRYPTIPDAETSLLLDENEPNRDLRIMFAQLPFRVIRIGNATSRGTPSLTVDHTISFSSFTYQNLLSHFSRKTVKHPTDSSIHGLLFICPKGGRQLTGPVNDNQNEDHPCYSDFIIAGLAKVEYLGRSGISEQRRLREWKAEFPYRCRDRCPGADLQPADFEDNMSVTPPSSPAPVAGPSHRFELQSQQSSSAPPITPPFDRDTIHRPLFHQPSRSVTDLPPGPFIMPERPNMPARSYSVNPPPPFEDFDLFEHRLLRDPSMIDDLFRVSGTTVEEAAHAFISVIKSANQNHHTAFSPSTKVRSSDHHILSLSNILLFRNWLFDAGLQNQRDVVGTGVMREVLMAALQVYLKPERGIVDDLGNADGFVTLKISPDFVSEDTLNDIFTFGALCAIFMIKAHVGPDPISPALILAAVSGVDSILDPIWVASTHEQVAEILHLVPVEGEVPIPDNRQLRFHFQSRLTGCRFGDILRSQPAERNQIVHSLYINTLLGASQRIVEESLEFKAFSRGLDLFLSPDIPSFAKEIRSSLKYILANSYNRRISSPFQVLDRLEYDVHPSTPDPELRQQLTNQLGKVKLAVERYLLGMGHPFPDRIHGLVDDDTIQKDNLDSAYRVRRFVKITSGLAMLPVDPQRVFSITLKDGIPINTYSNNSTDLIPPYPHACLYQLDLFVNDAFRKAINDANVVLGVDTEFDWMMHSAIVAIGGNDGFNG